MTPTPRRLALRAVVVDASAMVELLLGSTAGGQAGDAMRDAVVAVPAHFDAEVLSALGRLSRAGELPEAAVEPRLALLVRAPFTRYGLEPLLGGAWTLRHNLSLRDALYVALARRLHATLLTADARLGRAPGLGVPLTLVGS